MGLITIPPTATLELPDWADDFRAEARYKASYGGRSGAKTWTFAALLALEASERPLRIACLREFQKSLEESAKRTIEDSIRRAGLESRWDIQQRVLVGRNGSRIFFQGMSTATEETVKGLESVDRVWFEEAHRMSVRSREILYPTIRKPGSELWFSFNPRYRSDPVFRDFARPSARRDQSIWRHVNYYDNPWFSDESDGERLACLTDEPERYPHIWLGATDDVGEARKVLPYELLERCVKAWEQGQQKLGEAGASAGRRFVGLDVADSGLDKNALVMRQGPNILHVENWSASSLGVTARTAHTYCREAAALNLHYDVGGLGAGIRSHLRDMAPLPYTAIGENFGAAVAGPKRQYSRGVTNAEFFHRRNAQMGWGVRLRAMNTTRMLEGEPMDPARCLFISPAIPRLEDYLAECAQAEWENNISGRIVIEKEPDDAPSPDRYDATVLAFAYDSRNGLRIA